MNPSESQLDQSPTSEKVNPLFAGNLMKCPECEHTEGNWLDKETGIANCVWCKHTWQAAEPGPIPDLLDPTKPPERIDCPRPMPEPHVDTIPGRRSVYYKLDGYSGWSSPSFDAAYAEAERFAQSDRPRPQILKITEIVEVVT